MKKIECYSILCILLAFTACRTAKTNDYTEAQLTEFKDQIENRRFIIDAKWANPLSTRSINAIANAGLLAPGSTTNRIDLIGTQSTLEIEGDSVSANLPYYGERQIAGVYNNADVGIKFNGLPNDFKLDFNTKRQAYEMQFSIKNNTEVFDVNATLFPNNKVALYINSSQRLTIQYQGNLLFSESDDSK